MAFRMNHQVHVNSWTNTFEGLPIIEVPLLDVSEQGMERFIEQGMRFGVRSREERARTWTAYTTLSEFRLGASLVDPRDILILVVRPSGEILGSTTGPADIAGIERIRGLLG
jgi:hypothetical protein